MKPVRFTGHALLKMELLTEWGFSLDHDTVLEILRQPQDVLPGYLGRFIAESPLDDTHILRVVYEEDGEILVVTVYPARRERYED